MAPKYPSTPRVAVVYLCKSGLSRLFHITRSGLRPLLRLCWRVFDWLPEASLRATLDPVSRRVFGGRIRERSLINCIRLNTGDGLAAR